MNHTLESVCRELRLSRIPSLIDSVEVSNKEEWLLELLIREVEAKEERRIQRLIKQAKFSSHKTLEMFEWHNQILVQDEDTKEQLTSLDFIQSRQNVVCIGAPGTGKTHLATALGYKACQEGIETRFWRVSDLVIELEKAWKENQLERFKKKFNRVQLIILDEMGYVPFNKNGSELLFQLISDWYETKSIIITSNLEFSSWNKVFIDPRLTSALVDRLIHHAHILTFTGESYRLKNAISKTE